MDSSHDTHAPNSTPARAAKLFMNGRSQAVRLPAEFRFEDCDQVYIHRDKHTGDIVISKRPNTWESFFALADALPNSETDDFLSQRDNIIENEKDIF